MQVFVENDKIAFYDCDDTLIMWSELRDINDLITVGDGLIVSPNRKCIESLKNHKRIGNAVVVWSAGGAKHAKNVVDALGLNDYVDVILSKPSIFYDDLPASEFLHEGMRRNIR